MLMQMFGRLKLRKLSALQKLYVAMIVIACCLVFYAVGIMTNFFASPIFSMFFIISYETAHNIVSYVALTIAVGFCITALATRLVKKRKFVLREPEDKPVVGSGKASSGAPIQTTLSAFVKATNPTFPQSNSDNDATNNRETDMILDSEALTCPACKKKFINPIFVLDYSRLTPRLMRRCPFCDQPIDSEQKAPAEEIFVDSPIGIKIKSSD
jgi:hypothetical protein